jgi:uncharacterized RDD family membrane protein YckC
MSTIEHQRTGGSPKVSQAPLGLRIGALLIDMAVISLGISVLVYFAAIAGLSGLVAPVGVLLTLAYLVMFASLLGATPGMWLWGLRVIDAQGDRVSLGRALARTLLFVATLPFGFSFWSMLGNPERRGIHDRVAQTWVRKETTSSNRRACAWVMSMIAVPLLIGVLGAPSNPTASGPDPGVPPVWTLYTLPNRVVTAEFPGVPTATTAAEQSGAETIEEKRYSVALPDGTAYVLWEVPFTESDSTRLQQGHRDRDKIENGLEDYVRGSIGHDSVIEGFTPVPTALQPTVTFTGHLDGALFRGRAMYTDEGVYIAYAGGPINSSNFARFLESVRVATF